MAALIEVVLIVSAFLRKKSKLIFITTIVFMWTVSTFTYGQADQEIYLSRYYNPELWVGASEVFYTGLIHIFRRLNCSFLVYKAILSVVELTLIGTTIWRFSKYPNLTLCLYLIFPFPLNIAQMRNFLATSIIIYGIGFLIQEKRATVNKKIVSKYNVYFLISVIIASLFHSAALLWIVLLFANIFSVNKCILFIALINIFIYIFLDPTLLAGLLSRMGAGSRMMAYFSVAYQSSNYRHYGSILIILITFGLYSAFYIVFGNKRIISKNDRRFLRTVYKFNILSLITLSIAIRFTSEVIRIQQGILIFNYMAMTNLLKPENLNQYKIPRINIIIYAFIFVTIIYLAWSGLYRYLWETVVYPIYNNNLIWNFIK